ncbi:hypothetical protein BOX15_Mlig018733g1 [Macrostomum lignano]|uniref:Secreted protein n=3 Tax=Macrostomum lignano TaxID=282301 RepID=A0A1I8I1R3_9PLAT|nr:hypothetical protein BOX15_Mlig018733g1 [Macrostomum lignano]
MMSLAGTNRSWKLLIVALCAACLIEFGDSHAVCSDHINLHYCYSWNVKRALKSAVHDSQGSLDEPMTIGNQVDLQHLLLARLKAYKRLDPIWPLSYELQVAPYEFDETAMQDEIEPGTTNGIGSR